MKNRHSVLSFGLVFTALVLAFTSCKKINEATELGGDLIPPIDNINTFDTTLDVQAFNGIFTFGGTDPLTEDSVRSYYGDRFWLGRIDNDPIFGKTNAEIYFELKPESFRHTFQNKPDSLFLDSVVLVLDYVESYGDTLTPQTIEVYAIDDLAHFTADSTRVGYLMRSNDNIRPADTYSGAKLGQKTVLPAALKDSVKAFRDTTARQLRIPLDTTLQLVKRLLKSDTSGVNNYFASDSLFRTLIKGFALRSTGGNAIMGFNLLGANTKLAVYYRYYHGTASLDLDTTVGYFKFKPYSSFFSSGSAAQNFVERDYAGYPVQLAQGGSTPDPLVYIQNTPGTLATVKIPALAGLSNRVVHRAELIAEQVFHPSDSMFYPPSYLFVDAFVPSLSKFMTIPYDLIYDPTGGFNFSTFGVAPFFKLDPNGNVVREWRFNISRYVQHVVNGTEPAYDLRLFAPFVVTDQYRTPVAGSTPVDLDFGVNPVPVKGRVRLAGNTATPTVPDTNPQKMRLRIVYSKL